MPGTEKIQAANRQIRAVTNIGIVVNIALVVLKFVVGVLGSSMAIVADGIHSLSDLATDAVVLVGVHFGSKQADLKHQYGHGRIETFASVTIALVLILVGLMMVYSAGAGITQSHLTRPGLPVLFVAFLSIVAKEWLYGITRKVAVATQSSAVYANAWHHRSDAGSSVAVVIGVGAQMLGFPYGDHIAAMVVGFMIALVGVSIVVDCVQELTEASVDEETIEHIKSIINSNFSIRQWHQLRTRMVGRELFLDLHILVDPDLTVAAGHEISESLEKVLHAEMPRPVNITVHIEPDIPELRK